MCTLNTMKHSCSYLQWNMIQCMIRSFQMGVHWLTNANEWVGYLKPTFNVRDHSACLYGHNGKPFHCQHNQIYIQGSFVMISIATFKQDVDFINWLPFHSSFWVYMESGAWRIAWCLLFTETEKCHVDCFSIIGGIKGCHLKAFTSCGNTVKHTTIVWGESFVQIRLLNLF